MNCDQKNMLMSRCRFEMHLEDNSGSTIGMIVNKEAEKLSITKDLIRVIIQEGSKRKHSGAATAC